jgi:hypothetical protein
MEWFDIADYVVGGAAGGFSVAYYWGASLGGGAFIGATVGALVNVVAAELFRVMKEEADNPMKTVALWAFTVVIFVGATKAAQCAAFVIGQPISLPLATLYLGASVLGGMIVHAIDEKAIS